MINLFMELNKYMIVAVIVILVVYISTSIFLNKFNKLIYRKGTPMAWIPILNIYLLGKLAINKIVGWLLILTIIANGTFTITVNDTKKVYTLIPEDIKPKVSSIYTIVVLLLLIYSIIKYNKIKKASSIESITSNQNINMESVSQNQVVNNIESNPNQTNNNI